jgi:hypothetical protein
MVPGTRGLIWINEQRTSEYGLDALHLTLAFAASTVYRRLVLTAHDIGYMNCRVALIEAVILGKVSMIGGVLVLMVYLIFAMTRYPLAPRVQ